MRSKPALVLLLAIAATTAVFAAGKAETRTGDTTASRVERGAAVSITAGVTPFVAQLTLTLPETDLQSVEFVVAPKAGAKSRPIRTTYSAEHLRCRGLFGSDGTVTVPVFGLYAGYSNTVDVKFTFATNPARAEVVSVKTDVFVDPCGWSTPEVVVPRNNVPLSYDFFLVRGRCEGLAPLIVDTDGEVRWVNTGGLSGEPAAMHNNAVYHFAGSQLLKMELDGRVELLADYSHLGATAHHNMDAGKVGMLLEVDLAGDQVESTIMEVGFDGAIIKTWRMDHIIAQAMTALGDDPTQFVRPWPEDWFHMNSAVYWPQDDSIVVSSRENFVICIDYETGAIKWIFGDPNKKWHQFLSLRRFETISPPGTLPPIGQHALSITADNQLLLFNNGRASVFQNPPGVDLGYSVASKYAINSTLRSATETFRYENNPAFDSLYCSSIYEDGAGESYLLDYAFLVNVPLLPGGGQVAAIVGLGSAGEKAFEYRYASNGCDVAYNSAPVHLEDMALNGVCALQVVSATSRVTHGGAGDFDIDLTDAGRGVECRNTGGNYTLILTFNQPVVSATAAVTSGSGLVGSPTFEGSRATIPLAGVTDMQTITVSLTDIIGAEGQSLPTASVRMNVLTGDSTQNKSVNSSDIGQAQSQSGSSVDATNFRNDINANGAVSATDVSEIKANAGNSIP